MTGPQAALARRILSRHSKSFALAGRLLPASCRRDAAALYAWCRRCDDAVDLPGDRRTRAAAVVRLRRELDQIYQGEPQTDPVLAAFQDVALRHALPRVYPDDLIAGMAMDVGRVDYETLDELLLYCYRAAGTVGLMMARIMGVDDGPALRRAADLGIAMQLTNICRDVAEDERAGRVYLPRELLGTAGMPTALAEPAARSVSALLVTAEAFYRSGDAGLGHLPFRCAIAIKAARLIYAEIGQVIARRRFDVRCGRAVVSRGRKAWLLMAAVGKTCALFMRRRFAAAVPGGRPDAGRTPRAPLLLPLPPPPPPPPPLPFELPLMEGARP